MTAPVVTSSFYWPMRLLPADQRDAMLALYSFCRVVDDIVDEGRVADPLGELARWRGWLQALPTVADPAIAPLAAAVARFDMPVAELVRIVDGMAMDAGPEPIVAPDRATLASYCRAVAGAVGVASMAIFGVRGPQAEDFAVALGEALQLTNILRDIGEDAGLGRLYLARQDLDAAGVPLDPASASRSPDLARAARATAARADSCFERAIAALSDLPRTQLRAPIAMLALYRALLRRLVAADWRQPLVRVRLSGTRKLAVAVTAYLTARP